MNKHAPPADWVPAKCARPGCRAWVARRDEERLHCVVHIVRGRDKVEKLRFGSVYNSR